MAWGPLGVSYWKASTDVYVRSLIRFQLARRFSMAGMDSTARLTYPKVTPSKKYAVHTQRVAGHINGVLDTTSDASLINARPAQDGGSPGNCIRAHEKLSSLGSLNISPTSKIPLCHLF